MPQINIPGMGLRVPYMGSETCKPLKVKNHLTVGYTTDSANTSCWGNFLSKQFEGAADPSTAWDEPTCAVWCLIKCLNPGGLKAMAKVKAEDPEYAKAMQADGKRCCRHSTRGLLYNYATDVLVDVRSKLKNELNHLKTLRGSFSAVWKPMFASK